MLRLGLVTFSALAALTACTGGPDGDDGPDPFDSPPAYDPDCDGYDGVEVAGAMTWWIGQYSFNGDDIEGTETWALISNDAWAQTGEGWDCKIVWNIDGIKGDAINCATCDFSMAIHATPNESASDCHPALYAIEGQSFDETYNVSVTSSGARFSFADSGSDLAMGEANTSGASYETEPRCSFF